jgi:hypothetical protein
MAKLIMPSIRDRRENKRSGTNRWVGKLIELDGSKRGRVVAVIYGDTLEEMRTIKHIAANAIFDAMHPDLPKRIKE